MKTIIGSETEFGLVPRDKNRSTDREILSRLIAVLHWGIRFPGHLEQIMKSANWWNEDMERKEFNKEEDYDCLRRLGMTGEYQRNGSRLYVDGSHLEYSTPECTDPFETVAYERCGEEIAACAAAEVQSALGLKADLVKRNTDYHGHSYACHENYLTSRALFDRLVPSNGCARIAGYQSHEQAVLALHLATRQLFTGSGSFRPEKPWPYALGLSQRQPFVHYFSALSTTECRSIVNTRDRPYADHARFGRLHVICGDSNRADWSNILKYGTSRLVLDMLEDGGETEVRRLSRYEMEYPVSAFGSVENKNTLIATKRGAVSALDAQKAIYASVRQWHEARPQPEKEWIPKVMSMWGLVLDLIERDDERLGRMLDYFIKKRIFEEARNRGGTFDAKQMQALEYHYHVAGSGSFFGELREQGFVEELVPKESIARAREIPPESRAGTRTAFLEKYGRSAFGSAWHIVFFEEEGKYHVATMPDPTSHDFSIDLEDEGMR